MTYDLQPRFKSILFHFYLLICIAALSCDIEQYYCLFIDKLLYKADIMDFFQLIFCFEVTSCNKYQTFLRHNDMPIAVFKNHVGA